MKGNLIFINTNPISNMILSSGITAADFINGLDELPQNIILLNNDQQAANGYNSHSKFNLIAGTGEIRTYLLKNPDQKRNSLILTRKIPLTIFLRLKLRSFFIWRTWEHRWADHFRRN